MNHSRRGFLQLSATGLASAVAASSLPASPAEQHKGSRRYHFVQVDVFTANRLEGNQLAVFPDARGLSDEEMLGLARETNLQETTFVLPRDPSIEKEQGIKVRIFIPEQETPFGGHPTLGTAMVLRNRQADRGVTPQELLLDLQVGKIPVAFHIDKSGNAFGEMHQVDPAFGRIHDRGQVAALIGVQPEEISKEWPIQTVSTGLPFAIVPLEKLSTLQALKPNLEKIGAYFEREKVLSDFYYITRDTQDGDVGLRSRAFYPNGEDPATGSAAGCTAAWMVRYGLAKPGEKVHIRQGVEIKRPSQIFIQAERQGEKIVNVRVGGNAVEIMEGDFSL